MAMPLCDWGAIERARLATSPFRWAVMSGLLPESDARRLEEEFPAEGFTLTERPSGTAGGKGYRTRNLKLVDASEPVPDNVARLSRSWRALLDGLLSDEYRAALTALTGWPLDDCTLEVRAVRYGAGSWIDPHTDRADKAVTQTWYFNSGWRRDWEGALRILAGPSEESVVEEVLPRLGDSVVLVPSRTSWHSVAAVADTATDDRRTLLVHFVRPAKAGEAIA